MTSICCNNERITPPFLYLTKCCFFSGQLLRLLKSSCSRDMSTYECVTEEMNYFHNWEIFNNVRKEHIWTVTYSSPIGSNFSRVYEGSHLFAQLLFANSSLLISSVTFSNTSLLVGMIIHCNKEQRVIQSSYSGDYLTCLKLIIVLNTEGDLFDPKGMY